MMGLIFITACAAVICFAAYKTTAPDERKFLVIALAAAFLIRAAIAGFYQWYIVALRDGVFLVPDEAYYLSVAWCEALFMKLKDMTLISAEHTVFKSLLAKEIFANVISYHARAGFFNIAGFAYCTLLALLYVVFGYSALLARLMSISISLLVVLLVYKITRNLFGKAAARVASILVILLPAQNFIAITVAKDILLVFAILFLFFILGRMGNLKQVAKFLLPLIAGIFLIYIIHLSVFQLIVVFLSFALMIKIIDFKKRKIMSFVLIALLLAIPLNHKALPYADRLLKKGYNRLIMGHILISDQKNSATSYRLLPDKFYGQDEKRMAEEGNRAHELFYAEKGYRMDQLKDPSVAHPGIEAAAVKKDLFFAETIRFVPAAYIKGLFYVLFKPFPWNATNIRQTLAAVHMVFWYILLPFVCVGLYSALRRPTKDRVILALFFFIFTSALALNEGNVGGLFRHREIVSFAYVIFGAAGLANIFSKESSAKGQKQGRAL